MYISQRFEGSRDVGPMEVYTKGNRRKARTEIEMEMDCERDRNGKTLPGLSTSSSKLIARAKNQSFSGLTHTFRGILEVLAAHTGNTRLLLSRRKFILSNK